MQIFVTGTGTDVGKTLICSWLLTHSNYSYFKPIQTGNIDSTDSKSIDSLTNSKIYPELYSFKAPLSPHLAAQKENKYIDINTLVLPNDKNLIIEGAGGLMVPINEKYFIIDIIKYFNVPVILVAGSELGTINHTLLSIEAMRAKQIDILGVIVNGNHNIENCKAIQYYGQVEILIEFPVISPINQESLQKIPLPKNIQDILNKE